jgi:very-short-patch-repair endonuclease
VLVAGFEVDCWWPQAKLVVELDSREHHAHWSAAERDRERDARLMRLDIHSLRVTGRRLRRDRQALFGDIAARFEAAGEPLAGLPFR